MDESENLPVKFVAKNLATATDKRGSLAWRGLTALRTGHDGLYRQAREVYNRLADDGLGGWSGFKEREIPLAEVFDSFKQLAAVRYGKAYFPLSALYSGWQSVEGDSEKAERYCKLAFDWLHANQHLNDPEVWHDLGALYVGNNVELAIHWFQMAADAGDASSMWGLTGAYEHLEDWEEALYWQIKAAEAGHAEAQHGLEMQHEHGGLEFDDEQVFHWYVWSAEQGHVWAQLVLAEAYRYGGGNQDGHGAGVHQDAEEAVYWYTRAANQGEHHAQLQLGKILWVGRGVERDDEQAKIWLEKSAEQGDPEAQYQFAQFLFEQGGEEEKAAQLIECASDQDYGPAQYAIASDIGLFDVTDEQCAELFDKALTWYEEHATFGDPESRSDLALMHLDCWQASYNKSYRANRFDGLRLLEEVASEPVIIDVDGNPSPENDVQRRASRRLGIELLELSPAPGEVAEAIHWLEQAADLGDALACEKLAHLFLCGHPGVIHRLEPQKKLVAIDLQAASYWCGRAVQMGRTRAAYSLARYLLEGEHLPQNLALAEDWLLQAANAGNGLAQMLLGVEYESGERFPKNIGLAKYWYTNPAKEGRWLAAHNLARLLESDSEFEQAISLYKKAAYGGYKPSQQRLDELNINWKTT